MNEAISAAARGSTSPEPAYDFHEFFTKESSIHLRPTRTYEESAISPTLMRDYNEYYVFLNATPQSSQADIDRAYQSVIGEARRQGGFMLDIVEEGYRCLSDPTTRAQYHAGTYRHDIRVSMLRESHDREGRTAQFDGFPRLKKIQFYQYIFDSDEVNVTFEMLPNGKFRNTKTGEIVDQL